ncbi:hypothetical protein ACTMTI_34010 [Nonomuraea sp. H19]|uniref:hypothetical protein n=1 Tax=Nonomuraea sp. H19 TaxID=3452206 RepID=UPI003F8AF1C0
MAGTLGPPRMVRYGGEVATGPPAHGVVTFYGITWDPQYAGKPVTRESWTAIPDGRRRVIREWEEASRRVTEGSFKDVSLIGRAWH